MRWLLLLLLSTGAAFAQDIPDKILAGFKSDGKQATLSVSTVSNRVQIPTKIPGEIFVYNSGTERANIAFGKETVTAPDNEMHFTVGPGCGRAMATGMETYLAANTNQGTTNLLILSGHTVLPKHSMPMPIDPTEGRRPLRRSEVGCPK